MLQHVGVSFPVKQLFLLRFLVLMTAALQMKMKRLGNGFWMMMMSFRFPADALTYKHRNSLPGQELQLVMP